MQYLDNEPTNVWNLIVDYLEKTFYRPGVL